MIRKLTMYLVITIMAGFVVFPAAMTFAQAPASLTLTSSRSDVRIGEAFTVTVGGINLIDLYAYETVIEYDIGKLELVDMQSNIGEGSMAAAREENKLIFGYTKQGEKATESGNLTLCYFTFKAKAAGTSSISLESPKLLNGKLSTEKYTERKALSVTILSGGGGYYPVEEQPKPSVTVDGVVKVDVTPTLSRESHTAVAVVKENLLQEAFRQAKQDTAGVRKIILNLAKIEGAKNYAVELPAGVLANPGKNKVIEITTPVGRLTVPENMFSEKIGEGPVQLDIGIADKSGMEEGVRQKIGDRPVIELTAKAAGKSIDWNNPNAPVTVAIDYTPTAEELKNPEHIIVWYIDGQGKAVNIPSGRYDTATGKVTFTTTHFSKYAITFVKKTFGDIEDYPWAKKQIEVLASRGIVNGTSETAYSPERNITRADFMLLLVKTLGLTAEADSNFEDIKPEDYYYEALGIAKKLGIATGVGNNRFNPGDELSRQDMMVMVARALKITGRAGIAGVEGDIRIYNDASSVAAYAVEGVATLIKEGIVQGSNSRIHPQEAATRAETAVIVYRVFDKYRG